MTTLRKYDMGRVLDNGTVSSNVASAIWVAKCYRMLHACVTANSGRLTIQANHLLAAMSDDEWSIQFVPQQGQRAKPRVGLKLSQGEADLILDSRFRSVLSIVRHTGAAIEPSLSEGGIKA